MTGRGGGRWRGRTAGGGRRLAPLDPPELLAALRLERGCTLVLSRASLPATGEWLRTLDELALLVP